MKTEFVSNVSHELRTPMASIKGFTSTVLRDKSMSPETRERFLTIIYKESERLTTLIEELLDISCMESGQIHVKRQRFSLAEAVDRTMTVMAPLFEEKGVKLFHSIEESGFEIVGDLDRICQVVQNLLSNALKFTPVGGRVEVSLVGDRESVSLEVEDTGIGIPPEHLPRIFERFYRVPGAEGGGTGLGLTIVREIIERHRGRIDVVSEQGCGSRFRVTFPRPQPYGREEAR